MIIRVDLGDCIATTEKHICRFHQKEKTHGTYAYAGCSCTINYSIRNKRHIENKINTLEARADKLRDELAFTLTELATLKTNLLSDSNNE